MDGEYGVGCDGHLGETDISMCCINDALTDYHGVGDPVPWDLLYPIMIWYGMNWLDHCEREAEWLFVDYHRQTAAGELREQQQGKQKKEEGER